MASKEESVYICRRCNKTLTRESTKEWIKSFCEETGKDVHLVKVKNNHERILEKVRKE